MEDKLVVLIVEHERDTMCWSWAVGGWTEAGEGRAGVGRTSEVKPTAESPSGALWRVVGRTAPGRKPRAVHAKGESPYVRLRTKKQVRPSRNA